MIVEHERITAIRRWDEVPPDAILHDFGDLVLFPGLVDSHVHINEPGRTEWEGFATATQAAAAGGVTTLVDMPLNCVPETIDVPALEAKRAAAQGKAWVDWAAWGGVVRGNAESLPSLVRAGVPGFKCFLIHSGIDGFAWVDEADLRVALEKLRGTGLPLLAHAEVAGPVDAATTCAEQKWAPTGANIPPICARVPTQRRLKPLRCSFAWPKSLRPPFTSCICPAPRRCRLLRDARERGVPVTVETCAQYLWFAAAKIPDGATEYKCAPPIRDAANREALWNALNEGLIDMVITDHSPCPPEMKRRE